MTTNPNTIIEKIERILLEKVPHKYATVELREEIMAVVALVQSTERAKTLEEVEKRITQIGQLHGLKPATSSFGLYYAIRSAIATMKPTNPEESKEEYGE